MHVDTQHVWIVTEDYVTLLCYLPVVSSLSIINKTGIKEQKNPMVFFFLKLPFLFAM